MQNWFYNFVGGPLGGDARPVSEGAVAVSYLEVPTINTGFGRVVTRYHGTIHTYVRAHNEELGVHYQYKEAQ